MRTAGWTYGSIGNSARSSSATAYLAPHFVARSNLDVLIETQVTKVIKTGTKGKKPTFNQIEFAKGPNCKDYLHISYISY